MYIFIITSLSFKSEYFQIQILKKVLKLSFKIDT